MIFCFRERWVRLFSHIIIFQIRRNFWIRRKFCRVTRKSWKIAKNSNNKKNTLILASNRTFYGSRNFYGSEKLFYEKVDTFIFLWNKKSLTISIRNHFNANCNDVCFGCFPGHFAGIYLIRKLIFYSKWFCSFLE